jgi:hypothetical protein
LGSASWFIGYFEEAYRLLDQVGSSR